MPPDAPAAPGSAEVPSPAGVASIADGVVRHLDPRAVALARTQGAIAAASVSLAFLAAPAVVALASGVRSLTTFWLTLAWLLVTLLLAWWSQHWPDVSHRHQSYKVDRQGIEIRRGVVWRTVVNVPRSRVQHTDVAQGPLERNYGLGRVIVYTAGSAHARVALHGLAYATALRIRDYLLPGEGGDAL